MQLPKRDRDFRWNLNTLLQLATIAGMIVGGVSIYVNNQRDIDELKGWRLGHEILHKDRLAEVKGIEAAFDTRLKSLEETKIKRDSQVENLQQQVAALSEGLRQANAFNREVSSKLNDVVSDVRVVREILQRIEANPQRSP